MPAVKKSGGEGIEAALPGKTGCSFESQAVADRASLLFPEDGLPEKGVQVVIIVDNEWEIDSQGKRAQCIESPAEFLVGMDVRVEKETMHVPVPFAKTFDGNDGTGTATGVQKNAMHDTDDQPCLSMERDRLRITRFPCSSNGRPSKLPLLMQITRSPFLQQDNRK